MTTNQSPTEQDNGTGTLDKLTGKKLSQEQRVLRALTKADKFGLTNYQLSRLALKYTSVISDLRKEGHNIVCVREKLPNGKASNTYRYYLNEAKEY